MLPARSPHRAIRQRFGLLGMLAIFAIFVQPAQSADLTERQAALFTNNCSQCHTRPGIGVPQAGDQAAWKDRAARGEDAMLQNVVQGLRGMPPLGYCSACSEQDFRALIRLMAGLPDTAQGKSK